MKRIRRIIGLTAMLSCGGLAAAQTPVGSAFTYQGRLTDNGQPANGPYDFYIHLYDSAAGGTPTSPLGLTLDDVPVTNGLFTVNLDFGSAAFTGDARWLNIQVRPGASGGFYTVLTPRQPLAPAPYAALALRTAQWESVGNAVTNANTGFVGVNRSAPVTAAECFGIQSPATGLNYGGMYVGTDSATARPFYGYTTGPEDAWTYLEGSTGNWIVHNDGDRLVVTDTGNVGIGTTGPTGRLHVTSPSQPAGLFEVTGAGSLHAAVSGITAGPGTAVSGRNNGAGRAGSFLIDNTSSTVAALEGVTNGSGSAVYARKLTNTSGAALSAEAAAPTGVALNIVEGALRCQGAGANTNTFVFRHTSPAWGGNYSIINNPQTNGQPDLFLMVTAWWDQLGNPPYSQPHVCVFYDVVQEKWALLTTDGGAFNYAWKWNIMVIRP